MQPCTQATLKLKLYSLITSNTEQVIYAITGGILFKKWLILKNVLLAKQFFLFFSTVCSRGRLSNSEAVFIDDSLLLIVRPTLPLIATPRQGTSSQYQKSYLDTSFSYWYSIFQPNQCVHNLWAYRWAQQIFQIYRDMSWFVWQK